MPIPKNIALAVANPLIRPLPQEMLDYARSDTHFLLYCYDKVRNELIAKSTPDIDLVGEALSNSKETSLRRYEREAYDAVDGTGQFGWSLMLKRNPVMFTPEQLAVFKAVHQFRDKVARDEDDSHNYVMPKHHIYNLARLMPEDVPGVLSACAPISIHIRVRISDIISIIRTAREKARAEMPMILPVPEKAEVKHPVAAVTRPKESINIFDTVTTGTPRTDQSSFWGETFGSSKWIDGATKLGKALADVRLAVPLPQLTAAIFIDPNDPAPAVAQPQEPGSRAEHEFIRHRLKREDEDDIVVLKQVGGRRKRKRDMDEAPGLEAEEKTQNTDDDLVPQTIDEDVVGSAEPLGQGYKKKKINKTKDTTEESASTPKEQLPFQAFDYTNAPSVLKGEDKKEGWSSKAFNPYNKPGVGGPKGGKRGVREKDGKSMTFKK